VDIDEEDSDKETTQKEAPSSQNQETENELPGFEKMFDNLSVADIHQLCKIHHLLFTKLQSYYL